MPTTLYAGASVGRSMNRACPLIAAPPAPSSSSASGFPKIRSATAFVTASEHEGVCVPLLEAMAFDRPVIARDFGAIAETMDGAGVLLPADGDALLMAEALAEVATSPALTEELVARGRRRIAAVDPDAARAAFLDVLLEVA